MIDLQTLTSFTAEPLIKTNSFRKEIAQVLLLTALPLAPRLHSANTHQAT